MTGFLGIIDDPDGAFDVFLHIFGKCFRGAASVVPDGQFGDVEQIRDCPDVGARLHPCSVKADRDGRFLKQIPQCVCGLGSGAHIGDISAFKCSGESTEMRIDQQNHPCDIRQSGSFAFA